MHSCCTVWVPMNYSLLLPCRKASSRKVLLFLLRHSLFYSQHSFLFHCRNRPINHRLKSSLYKAKQFQLTNWWSLANLAQFPGQHLSTVHLPIPSLELLLFQVHFLKLCRAETQDWDAIKPKTDLVAYRIPYMQTYGHYKLDVTITLWVLRWDW